MPNVVKISAQINAMQNINNLRFVPSLSLTSLKLCTCLSTIKHQHSKKLTRCIEATEIVAAEIVSLVWAPQQISTGFTSWKRYCIAKLRR